MSIKVYAFYNNKGGVGKTTLCSNASILYAEQNPEKQILVIDMCPQANISQFLLGGGKEGYDNNQKLQSAYSRRNVVGFVDWILKGNADFKLLPKNSTYKVRASLYNEYIPENLYLIAGDSFLESLSLALNYAVINPANISAWKDYMTAIKRLCESEKVSASLGIALHQLPHQGKTFIMPDEKEITLTKNTYEEAVENVEDLVSKL